MKEGTNVDNKNDGTATGAAYVRRITNSSDPRTRVYQIVLISCQEDYRADKHGEEKDKGSSITAEPVKRAFRWLDGTGVLTKPEVVGRKLPRCAIGGDHRTKACTAGKQIARKARVRTRMRKVFKPGCAT